MLPFNAWWTNLHPDGEIDVSYSDDYGRTWTKGNGGRPLEPSNNASSFQAGHVEDKQWVAVDHFTMSPCRDTVYAMWAVFNGSGIKVRYAVSYNRGQTFSKDRTLSPPSRVGPAVTYVYPSVGSDGTVYASVVSFPPNGGPSNIYVTKSTDCGRTWMPFVAAVQNVGVLDTQLPNTTFRDGVVENFTASPSLPGHPYLTYEDWDGTQMDVYFKYTADGGTTWQPAGKGMLVNDNLDSTAGPPTDQFQPSVAAGTNGAVAVAFYDRRLACPPNGAEPADASIAHPGAWNFCINTSLQAYKDSSSGVLTKVGGNVRISKHSWDPEQPVQTVDGLPQTACASHSNPCSVSFIGDYFGLAMSPTTVYGLFVSTHYPSSVQGDDSQGPVYYQQQILAKVPRSSLGAGY